MTNVSDRAVARPLVAAGALLFDRDGRVLLVRPAYKPMWDIPGGYVEAGESPLGACIREIAEELGITAHEGRLLVIDWAPAQGEGDKLLFVFDGGTLTPKEQSQVRPDGSEVIEWQFVATDLLEDYVPDRLARRIRTAAKARGVGRTEYAEHGTAHYPE